MADSNLDFLIIGGAHRDLIARADTPAAPGQSRPGACAERSGGVGYNIAVACARGGRRTALATALGDDAAGRAVLTDMEAAGLTPLIPEAQPGPTSRYIVIEGPGGEAEAAVMDGRALEAVAPAAFAALLQSAPRPRAGVIDANLTPAQIGACLGAWDALAGPEAALAAEAVSPAKIPRFAAALPRLARIHANLEEAEALLGWRATDARDAVAGLLAIGAREAAVTDGARPAAAGAADGPIAALAPPRASGAGSATGCGDAFVAAYAAARLDGATPESALAAAANAGAAAFAARAA